MVNMDGFIDPAGTWVVLKVAGASEALAGGRAAVMSVGD